MDNSEDQLIYVNFNQDASCLAIGTERGFKIFHTSPFKDSVERTQLGGVSIIEMFFKTNIVAIVGSDNNKKHPKNKVVIWDDRSSQVVTELVFTSTVLAMKLKKDKIYIVLENKIYIFSMTTYKNIDTIDTYNNPNGIFSLTSSPNFIVIAYPDKTRGFINIKSYDKNIMNTICCHESDIQIISLNSEGNLIATASDKGTMIRIFSTMNGEYLKELRRGREKAEISSICFSGNSKYLACSSERGTIHIFSLYNVIEKLIVNKDDSEIFTGDTDKITNSVGSFKEKEEITHNRQSFLSVFKSIIPIKYFNSEWSFNQFRIPEMKSICSFGVLKNTILTVTSNGVLYEGLINKKSGQCDKSYENKLTLISK